MLEKTHGAVGCSHCQGLGADQTCPMCRRPVCQACLAPETCPDPSVRELKLGLGARLRDVDCRGRRGLVASWTGSNRLVDLATGKVLIRKLPLTTRGPWSRPLLMGDSVVSIQSSPLGASLYTGLRVTRLDDMVSTRITPAGSLAVDFTKAMAKSEDDRLALVVRSDETVDVLDVAQGIPVGRFSVPGQVVHSAAVCSGSDMLALGTYGRVTLFRVSDQQRLGTCRTFDDGNVVWVGLGRRRAAAITEHSRCTIMEIAPSVAASRWERRRLYWTHSPPGSYIPRYPDEAVRTCLDPEGELLAEPYKKSVLVYKLKTGKETRLDGHTDTVSLARFVLGGRMLVTADNDARVRLWPRVGEELMDS